jgi:hypothetical protein
MPDASSAALLILLPVEKRSMELFISRVEVFMEFNAF